MEVKLLLNQLMINQRNPRYDEQDSEEDEIDMMLTNMGDKIFELARHVTEKGLDPAKLVRIFPYGQKYVVYDGNRRITALKCVQDPSIIKDVKLKKKFEGLKNRVDFNKFLIKCYVFKDEEEMNERIELDHTGENDGVGQVKRDAIQTDRFKGFISNKTSLGLQLLSRLEQQATFPQELKCRLHDVHISTLNRLLSDPECRKTLGLGTNMSHLVFEVEQGEIVKVMAWLINKMLDRKFSVKNVYHKEDRRKFMEDLPDNMKPDLTKVVKKGLSQEGNEQGTIKTDELHQKKTPRETLKTEKKLDFFGKALYLKKSDVASLYADILDLYKFYEDNKTRLSVTFPSIIRMSLRLIVEAAAGDTKQGIDGYITANFEEAKKTLGQDSKTFLHTQSVSGAKQLISMLQTGAHNYSSSKNIEQAKAMSIIIGEILIITHGKK